MRKSSASGDFYKMIEKTLLFFPSARSNKSLIFKNMGESLLEIGEF